GPFAVDGDRERSRRDRAARPAPADPRAAAALQDPHPRRQRVRHPRGRTPRLSRRGARRARRGPRRRALALQARARRHDATNRPRARASAGRHPRPSDRSSHRDARAVRRGSRRRLPNSPGAWEGTRDQLLARAARSARRPRPARRRARDSARDQHRYPRPLRARSPRARHHRRAPRVDRVLAGPEHSLARGARALDAGSRGKQLTAMSRPGPEWRAMTWRRRALWGLLAAKAFAGIGVGWDIRWHVVIGRDSFWIPPHVMTYTGVVLASALSLGVLL